MSEEMPERIEVIMTGPKDVFGWVFGKYDGTLQATEYVRADKVRRLVFAATEASDLLTEAVSIPHESVLEVQHEIEAAIKEVTGG